MLAWTSPCKSIVFPYLLSSFTLAQQHCHESSLLSRYTHTIIVAGRTRTSVLLEHFIVPRYLEFLEAEH